MPTPKTKILLYLTTNFWRVGFHISEHNVEKMLRSNRFTTSRRGVRRLMRYFEDIGFVERVEDGYVVEQFVRGRNEQGFAIIGHRTVYRRAWRNLIVFQK